MTDITVTQEFDYATVDADEWVNAWATHDVTDQWTAIIHRAHEGGWFGDHYLERYTWFAMQEAFRKRAPYTDEGELSEWTGNQDNALSVDLSIDSFKLANDRGHLVFIEFAPNGLVSTPDRVLIFDSVEDVYTFTRPEIRAGCASDHYASSYSGYRFDMDESGLSFIAGQPCPECGGEMSFSCWADA